MTFHCSYSRVWKLRQYSSDSGIQFIIGYVCVSRTIITQLKLIYSSRNSFFTVLGDTCNVFLCKAILQTTTTTQSLFWNSGIMLYIREDIPSRLIEKKLRNNSEYFFVEINLRKKKWLPCCSYNPHKNSISTHTDFLRRELDLHSSNYENFILLGDFNSEMTDKNLKDFCNLYLLKNLIKKPTCFKNPENPKTIDLILTNRPRSFCNSDTLETGLSDVHKLTVTVLKMFFKKQSPNVISYRNYKNFSNDSFPKTILAYK